MSLSSINGWPRAIAGLSLLLLLLVVLHVDTFLSVAGAWNRWSNAEFYSHGYLVLLMSVYIVYHDRGKLALMVPCPGVAGILSVALIVLLWVVADLADVQLLEIIALLLMVVAILWTVLGWSLTRALLTPVFILLFALPIWAPLPPLLQVMTANTVYAMARTAGLPALQQGQVIMLPAGSLEVAESCSGLGYLLAALTLGIFYGWLYYRGFLRRLLVIFVAGVTAITANILRVFIVVYVAYKTDMQHPMISNHYFLGWYLFGGLALVLMLIDGLIVSRSGKPAGVKGSFMPSGSPCNTGTPMFLVATISAAVLLAGGSLLVNSIKQTEHAASVSALTLPAGKGGWSGPVTSHEIWEPVYQGAITRKHNYIKDGAIVTLYLGYYPQQEQGRELVYYNNAIADVGTWRLQDPRNQSVADGAWQAQEHVLVSAGGQRRLVWHWYRLAGRTTASRYIAKLLQVVGQLTGNNRAAVVAVATEAGEDGEAARQRLDDFVSVMKQQLIQLADGQ